jgi:hypothetical protein
VNTFALILLAWPLYLAVNGVLVEFAGLATKSGGANAAADAELSKGGITASNISSEISSANTVK